MRTEGELRALVVLLGDEGERISLVAWEQLLIEEEAAIPHLKGVCESPDPRLRGRARLLLDEINNAAFERQWRAFTSLPDDDLDLERGCLLLSHLYGEPKEQAIAGFLDAIASMVRAHMPGVGGLRALGEVLFENLGFRGGDFAQPESHYLQTVLERRTGIPISLAMVYLLVGRRVGLPVAGVAMPGHYLVRYERPGGPAYVDCYNRGHMYQYDSLVNLLTSKGITFSQQQLSPCTHRFSLFRMMNNLEKVYLDANNARMAGRISRFRSHLYVED